MSSLKSWRELLATPLSEAPKGGTDETPGGIASANHANPQTPDSLRVDLFIGGHANPTQMLDPCVIAGCVQAIGEGDLVYCAAHRVKADDGSLWGPVAERQRLVRTGPNTWMEAEWCRSLCVFCEQSTAPGDLITCAEHRARLDAIVMPWDDQS